MENYSIFDVEGDSLTPTKIYCMTVEMHREGEETKFFTLTEYSEMREFLLNEEVLVGHNIILWDIPRLERILFDNYQSERTHRQFVREEGLIPFRIKARLIDTLALSWYLKPLRLIHGLDSYGQEFGIEKPKITSWTEQTLEEYIHRNREDVKINSRLFDEQIKELEEIYDGKIDSIINYLMFKMDCIREQEAVGWKLDIEKAQYKISQLNIEINKKSELLSLAMPEVTTYREFNIPAKMFKIDGTISKRGASWKLLLADLGFSPDYSGQISLEKERSAGNPGSFTQIKDWLYTLGWVPETWKFTKNKKTGKVSMVAQLSLPKSEGGGICPSIKKMYKDTPVLQELENLFVFIHRRSILKGFLRDVDEDGYLMAQMSGFTNTLRFKHSTIVNLPKVTGMHKEEEYDWHDGVHIRGCLTVPEGYTLIGSDMASLEDRTKQHFMYFFDPEYVRSMIKPDFDPHLDLAVFAKVITEEDILFYNELGKKILEGYIPTVTEKDRYNLIKKERYEYKTINYGAAYGAGALTMSRNSGMSEAKANDLLIMYWKKNWAVKKVARATITKIVRKQRWLKNPVSGYWYSLRAEKDKFSTLNQGLGVYCVDLWIKEARDKGLKLCGQFHDEGVFPIRIGEEKRTEEILRNAIRTVNNNLQLNRELDIDVQRGFSYADIH